MFISNKVLSVVLTFFSILFFSTIYIDDVFAEGQSNAQRQNNNRYRSIDGSNNNKRNPDLNSIFTKLGRLVDSDYGDGISSLAGDDRPNPREISNAVVDQDGISIPNELGTSDILWQWGQFLDHDIDLTGPASPAEPENIPVPIGDPDFDPMSFGGVVIPFSRSVFDPSTGTDTDNPREQENEITGWIDASNVYGSDEERALGLRTLDGTGKLKTSDGNLLPFNTEGLPNDNGPMGGADEDFFVAGDVRVNEQIGLTAMHTLFVREHNRLAEEIAEKRPNFSGERIYQEARKIVGAQMQVITYREFLPALLGPRPLPRYRGYKKNVDPSIVNVFSTAAFRFGHSALSSTLLRIDSDGNEISEGNISLSDAFFTPETVIDEGGIEPILRGLVNQLHQKIDSMIIDDVRNFLFGPPGAGGFDLASLNIKRGRDHGLPSYNETRVQLGLDPAISFADVNPDLDVQNRLASIYDTVDDIDLWVGGLSEPAVNGGHVGELFSEIISIQFQVLRDGDRFWWQRNLKGKERRELRRTTLADIIRRNTDINDEIPDNVFFVE